MINVITPFQRKENLDLMANVLKDKANWIVLIDNEELLNSFPDWVTVKLYDKSDSLFPSNVLINNYLSSGELKDDEQYMILCDDDSVEEGFFDKIPDKDVVCVSMKRGDKWTQHVVWDDWFKQTGHWEESVDILIADPKNMRIACVGGEQVIMKGKVWGDFRYGLSNIGDGEMIMKVKEEYDITYVPDAFVLFNYYEEGRFDSFHRKPQVLFIGDFWCAGYEQMGKSEWEGNIWASLEATGLVDLARFHFDKFYKHTGQRPDQALIDRIEEVKPDFIVLIIYRYPGSLPSVIHEHTLAVIRELGIPIITIWGDLQNPEQRAIADIVRQYTKVNVGTAKKEPVESIGFRYMHVPKDPRIWNDPKIERDVDVVFFGSYGVGREERQEALQYLIDNGIKLLVGGSEGRDHYSTEDYAGGYKRAKIAVSFSKANGENVVNARVFEAMNCGAMLLEQHSPELENLYTKDVDFKEWIDKVDLLEKVRYYLEHDDERKSIAEAGYNKTQELYSAKTFWQTILELIK